MNNTINNVAIVGGTHGNELAGVYLVNYWRNTEPQFITRASFSTETLLANTKAIGLNKRYFDSDLNRQFSAESLANMNLSNYEQSRAKVINQQLGPKGNPKSDLIIDLHNTTSNMGPSLLIPQQGEFYDLLAIYVREMMPEAVVLLDEDHIANQDHHLLSTIAKRGVIVEVGPVPQGVLKHEVNEQMAKMTGIILDFVELYNLDNLPQLPSSTDAFRYLESLTLPVNDKNERMGMVHKNIEGNDFQPVKSGDPIFALFDGTEINYQGDKTVYPAFINEAAYYDNNLAMSLCEKVVINNPR
ncbi:putative aspartoacylase [Psychrosphaera saromensis]|uniref:Aspartoacylase n=1 Tax=Psychrosphaera saromensis TaxID=716813 RepID=A0A2S7UZ36_9GAMM|nr:aspartoacylase [Psychrosphaera saromensis]PQJ54998.1 aspartoacylase [Psychrosphaera saromensis]GHB55474.1 putative aspartoacylase [Psychrosphaera saromensis]GLQ13744.1 putative aspartoacylase [Psychrosphaera saromensis]